MWTQKLTCALKTQWMSFPSRPFHHDRRYPQLVHPSIFATHHPRGALAHGQRPRRRCPRPCRAARRPPRGRHSHPRTTRSDRWRRPGPQSRARRPGLRCWSFGTRRRGGLSGRRNGTEGQRAQAVRLGRLEHWSSQCSLFDCFFFSIQVGELTR